MIGNQHHRHQTSGRKQKEQSWFNASPHLARFFCDGRQLFMQRMVKFKMFFGSFDGTADQRVLNCDTENFVTREKNEPWQTNRDCSLFSCLER